MIRNYFKTAFRNLWKNRGQSFLNIAGLAIGIASAALIFLWVEDEMGYDQFNVKKDRLFYIRENQRYDTYVATFGSTPGLLGPAIQKEIPGIANTCRASEGSRTLLFSIGDKAVYAKGKYAEPSLFSMFTLPFLQGDIHALDQLHSIVLTESATRKFFGSTDDVLGKTVRVDNEQDYVVTGILKDVPQNSTLQFEWLMPFQVFYDKSPWLQRWGNNSLSTYLELNPGVDTAKVNHILYDFIQKREPEAIARPFLWSMNDWRLRDEFENGKATGGGRIEFVRMFSIIAWIILLIACINFMNLATARSEKRAREVGVRKVLGAIKVNLVVQFIGEALVLSCIGAILALILVQLALPSFNLLVSKNLTLGLSQPTHPLALLAIALVCGLVAGSYPSLYLSSFNPVFVLKGIKLKSGSASLVRKGLVIIQFAVSTILIISTIVIYLQIQHVKNRKLGFNKENLVQIKVQGNIPASYDAIREDLMASGLVSDVALSDHATIYGGNNTSGFEWEGKPESAEILISNRGVTPGYFKTSGMKLLEGRDFRVTDTARTGKLSVIITKSLEELMGKGSAIGKSIWYRGDTTTRAEVVGVIDNYMYGYMYGKPDPVLFTCAPPAESEVLYVRIKQGVPAQEALRKMEAVLKANNPAYPFDYVFVQDQFNNMFSSESMVSRLTRIFAFLAIFISCLGLFGLATYMAERRTKEMGIRKVLGAGLPRMAWLLSSEFLMLVGAACLIAFPIAWWLMHNWLQGFPYRVAINAWIFPATALLAMLIALMTIGFQVIRAAMVNPVRSLRSE